MIRIIAVVLTLALFSMGCGDEENNASNNGGVTPLPDLGKPDMAEDLPPDYTDVGYDMDSPFPAIVIVPADLSLKVGQSRELEAKYYDINEELVTGAAFTWTAEKPDTVSVDEYGTVTARAAGFGPINVVSDQGPVRGQIVVNTHSPHVDITAGRAHTCAQKRDGRVVCWGDNSRNQMASARPEPRLVPTRPNFFAGEVLTHVAAGSDHTCATDDMGGLHCWGYNSDGQLGSLDTEATTTGVRTSFPAGNNIPVLGANFTCVLLDNKTLTCFGENSDRVLKDSADTPLTAPVRVHNTREWKSVVAGDNHMCGLEEDLDVWCWGADDKSQLGPDGNGATYEPVQIPGQWVDLYAGKDFTCGLNFSQNLECWGASEAGFGDGVTFESSDLVEIDLMGASATDITIGNEFICATGGNVTLCWGKNDRGQLGDNMMVDRFESGPVRDSYGFKEMAAGGIHICGVTTNGDNFCWGGNTLGQLGDDSQIDRRVPTFSAPRAN